MCLKFFSSIFFNNSQQSLSAAVRSADHETLESLGGQRSVLAEESK